MYPKARNPFVCWLLTVATSGIYAAVWVWRVTTELNNAENQPIFKVRIWRNTFIPLYLAALLGAVWSWQSRSLDSFLLTASLALCLIAFMVHVQVSIGNYIKSKDIKHNSGASYSNTLSVVLFWLVANTGIAYMQCGINRVIQNERTHS